MVRMRAACPLIFLLAISVFRPVPARSEKAPIPPHATHCDISVPIRIELVPPNGLQVGRTALFQVRIESDLDPSLVQRVWVEYEIPEKLRPSAGFSKRVGMLNKKGEQRYQIGISIPDRKRYQLRARLNVQLVDGTILGRTAVRYVDLGNNPPDGMIGRIVNPDGTGIRIYQGQTGGE